MNYNKGDKNLFSKKIKNIYSKNINKNFFNNSYNKAKMNINHNQINNNNFFKKIIPPNNNNNKNIINRNQFDINQLNQNIII